MLSFLLIEILKFRNNLFKNYNIIIKQKLIIIILKILNQIKFSFFFFII
jgi:hypothetical protein